jgi:hypothetical protein
VIRHCVWIVNGWLSPRTMADIPADVAMWLQPVDDTLRVLRPAPQAYGGGW